MLTQKPPRSYPAPRLAGGGSYTLEDLEWIAAARKEDDVLADWARKVVAREDKLSLDQLLRDDGLEPAERVDELPAALVVRGSGGVSTVRGLVRRDRAFIPGIGWGPRAELTAALPARANSRWAGPAQWEEIPCSTGELAGLFRLFRDGVEEVGLRECVPKGWLDGAAVVSDRVLEPGQVLAAANPAGQPEVPAGAVVTAVVDELDKTAVLELLAVAPGPVIYRRHDGAWYQDDKWLAALQSVKPPPLVKLADPEQIDLVAKAVDASTAGEPFDPNQPNQVDGDTGGAVTPKQRKRPGRKPGEQVATPTAAAGWLAERNFRFAMLEAVDMDRLEVNQVVQAAPRPAGVKGAERLRQYWMNGEGAAKIMWGTPRDWTRCVGFLSKYLGVRAKGYCNLLHARKLGYWPNSKPQAPSPGTSARAKAKELDK